MKENLFVILKLLGKYFFFSVLAICKPLNSDFSFVNFSTIEANGLNICSRYVGACSRYVFIICANLCSIRAS